MPDPFSDRLGFDSGFSGASYRLGFGGGVQGGERLGFGGSAFGGTSGNRSFGWDPIDLFAQQAAKESQQWSGGAGTGIPGSTGGVGAPVGQSWANVNRWDSHILRASQETGVPADIIKAIMMLESQGNPNAMSVSGYYGLMQIGPQSAVPSYMRNRGWLAADPYNQVLAGATELRNKYNALGQNWDMAIRGYLGFGTDALGTTDQAYLARVNQYRQQINSTASAPGGFGGGAVPSGAGANNIVQLATQFVGKVPYVWGGIPGKGQSPYGGWDCSGFTYWLDQNYGNGALPMGSHYQFQYAQRTGQLFSNMAMLQPGDLIFIDSGWQGGAGANLNRAGHVAMYAGNGMIVHAANAQEGTILSPLSRYRNILGAMHMSWSGGAGGGFGTTPWQQQTASGGNWFNQSLSSILAGARR